MGCLLLEPMEGLVIKNTGSDYIVRSPQGDFPCKVKGNFRIRGIKSTNPVAVGDPLGTMTVTCGEETIAQLPLVAGEAVPRITFGQMLLRMLRMALLSA